MKKSLLITLFLLGILVVPAKADMTVEESTDAEYLINSGFSQVLVEDVFIQKNRATAKPAEPLYEKSQNRFVKALKKLKLNVAIA